MEIYLKEPFEPPNLEYTLSDKNTNLKDAPPLDSIVCALGCVPMSSFSDDDVRLFVLNLGDQFRELPHFKLLDEKDLLVRGYQPSASRGSDGTSASCT